MRHENKLKRLFTYNNSVFIVCLIPFFWLVWQTAASGLGANPIEKIIHITGDWTLNFLMLTLALAPLSSITGFKQLLQIRRMLGLYSFFYACLHFITYFGIDHLFSLKSALDDAIKHKRIFAGFFAFLCLLLLAVTSNQRLKQRLGKTPWQTVHFLVYPAALGGVIHYLLLVKKDIQKPLIYAGILSILLGYRIVLLVVQRLSKNKQDKTQ